MRDVELWNVLLSLRGMFNLYLSIFSRLIYRVTGDFTCQMSLQKYPFDIQACKFEVESCK